MYNNLVMICSGCKQEGHKSNSLDCPINKEVLQDKFNRVKDFVLNKYIDDAEVISQELNIPLYKVKQLIQCISNEELIEAYTKNVDDLVSKITQIYSAGLIQCEECYSESFSEKSVKIWKSKKICSSCNKKHDSEREEMWSKIYDYTYHNFKRCYICNKEYRKDESFHFDHKNMFIKYESICTMVYCGYELEEIIQELRQCNLLCLSCHCFVTKMETFFPFTKIKSNLTRCLNNNEIKQDQLEEQYIYYNKIYSDCIEKMYPILSKIVLSKRRKFEIEE